LTSRGPVVVLGGGVAGLAAGYYLSRAGFPVTVVERAPVLGGLCGSFEAGGFTLDHGPHKLYSVVPGILDEIRALLGDRLLEHKKKNRIRLLGRYLDYPLSLGNLLPLLGPARAARLGAGYAGAIAGGLLGGEPRTYEEYILRRFGRGVYELVFEPLAWKVWGNPAELSADLARARIPSGGASELILRLLKLKEATPDDDAPFFYYPRGGFGVFPDRLAEEIRAAGGSTLTGAAPARLERAGARVTAVEIVRDGKPERLPCETLVSSIPLSTLAGMLYPGDAGVAADVARLRLRDLALVFVFVDRDRLVDDHWIFFPERKYPFNRMFEQKSMDPGLGPKGKTAICCDLTCDAGDPVWTSPDEHLVRRCFDALVEAGVAPADGFAGGLVRRFRSFYPMYTVDYRERLSAVYSRLGASDNLVLTGRVGMFNYNNSDHCLDMGRFIASEMTEGKAAPAIRAGLEERVKTYRIID
jgi:protoporphyrinogen oxidase